MLAHELLLIHAVQSWRLTRLDIAGPEGPLKGIAEGLMLPHEHHIQYLERKGLPCAVGSRTYDSRHLVVGREGHSAHPIHCEEGQSQDHEE